MRAVPRLVDSLAYNKRNTFLFSLLRNHESTSRGLRRVRFPSGKQQKGHLNLDSLVETPTSRRVERPGQKVRGMFTKIWSPPDLITFTLTSTLEVSSKAGKATGWVCDGLSNASWERVSTSRPLQCCQFYMLSRVDPEAPTCQTKKQH